MSTSVLDAASEPLAATPSEAPRTWRTALVLAGAHGIIDVYSAFLSPLLPRLMTEMGLSITRAATLTTTTGLASSLLQPFMGALSDRYGARAFIIAGPLLCAIFTSLMGIAPGFATLALFLAIGGIGTALFHPPATALAADAQHGGRIGARVSLFSFGGALGFALGPLIAVAVVTRLGMQGLWLTMIPALILVPLLALLLPRAEAHPHERARDGVFTAVRLLRGPVGVLFFLAIIGTFVPRVFITLQPIAIAHAGGSEALGAATLSTYLLAQAAGSLAGGFLADRCDRVRLLFWLMLAALPMHLLALALPPGTAGAVLSAAVAGLLNMALLAPLLVMAQEASPHGAATSAGIILGLSWAVAAVVMIPAGMLGDVVGARTAALLCMPVLLLGCAAALHPALRPLRSPAR